MSETKKRSIVASTLALAIGSLGASGLALADRFTPHLDDVEIEVLDREAALPPSGPPHDTTTSTSAGMAADASSPSRPSTSAAP